MNAPAVVIPAVIGEPGRPPALHAAIYLAFMVEDMSAESAAKHLATLGYEETRNSILAYADRQGWKKGNGSGPKAGRASNEPYKPGRADKARRPGAAARVLVDLDLYDPETNRLLERHCRFPVGKSPIFRMADQLFCGEPATVDSYCLKCASRAYPPAALQKKVADHATTPRPIRNHR